MKKVSLMKKMGVMLLASLFLVGCTTPGESIVADPSLQLLSQDATVYFSVLGKSDRTVVTVTANMDWELTVETAAPAVNWVNVDKTGGTRGRSYVSYTVEANPLTQARECDLVFRGKGAYAGKVVKIHIIQEGSVISIPELETDPITKIEAATTGDEGDIRVERATRPWTVEVVEGADWLTLDKTGGDVVNVDPNKVNPDDALLVHWTAAEFAGSLAREARVKFTVDNPEDPSTPLYSREVIIRQEPVALTLVSISPDPILVHQQGTDATPASFTFDVNRSWVAAVTDPVGADWISLSATEGEDGKAQKIDLIVLPNPDYTERTAEITVTAGTATFVVPMKQQGAGINVPPYSLIDRTFPPMASFIEFANITVDNGEPWTATTDADWLTLEFGEGYDSALPVGDGYNDVLKATATANPKAAQRTATITIKSGEMSSTFEVVQEAAGFNVTSDMIMAGNWESGFTYKVNSDGTNPIELSIYPTNQLPWNLKVEYQVGTDWIEHGLVNLQGHNMGLPYNVDFSFLPNPTDAERKAVVTFYTGAEASPDMSFTLTVTQMATLFVVEHATVNFPPQGSYQTMDDINPDLRAKAVKVDTDNFMPITYVGPVVTGSDPAVEADWLTLVQTAAGFELLCDRNPGAVGRSATLTVVCGDMKKDVVVTQDPAGALSLSETEVILGAHSGHAKNALVTNYSNNNIEPVYAVTYSQGEGWLDVALTKTSNTDYKVILTTLTPNTTLTQNQAEVKISCGDVEAVLVVKQRKMNFVLTPKLPSHYNPFDDVKMEQKLENYPENYLFNQINNEGIFVSTNIPEVPWTVVEKAGSNTDPDKVWFSFDKESQELFRFNVLQFNDFVDDAGVPAERSVVLTFTQGEQSYDLTFIQKAGDITLQKADPILLDAYAYTDIMWRATSGYTPDVHAVAINGVRAGLTPDQLYNFVLARDYQVEVTKGAEWLTLTYERDTKYPDYGAIRFNALANPTDKERVAEIKISYGRMSTTTEVRQKAAELVLATTSMSSTSEVAGPDRKIQLSIDGTPLNEMNAGDHFYLTGSNLLGLTVASFDAPAADWFKTAVVPSTLNVPQVDPNAYWPGMDLPGYMNGDIKVNDGTNLENLDAATLLVYDILPNPREQERVHKMRVVLGDANGEHIEFPVTFSQPGATLTVENRVDLADPKGYPVYDLNALVLDCTGAAWTVAAEWLNPANAWFTFARTADNVVKLTKVEPNPTDQPREMNLVFTSGEIVKRTRVVQPAAFLDLKLDVINLDPSGAGGQAAIELVETNNGMDWSVTPEDNGWFTVQKGLGSKLEIFNIQKNETGQERSAVLTITCGEMSKDITVRQAPYAADFSLQTLTEVMPATEMPIGSPVTISDICDNNFSDWTVGSYDDTWVTVVKQGNKLIVTKCLANPSFDPRTVTIPIEYAGVTLSFTLKQEGGQIKFSANTPANLVADLNGGNYAGVNFELNTVPMPGTVAFFHFTSTYEPDLVTISVKDGLDWITPYLLNTGTPNEKAVWVNVKANATGDPRSAVLVIKSGEMTREITVYQAEATLLLSTESLTFDPIAYADVIPVTVDTEDPNWVVDASTVEWMTATRVANSIKVTLTPNNTGLQRSALVVVRNADRSEAQTVRIFQNAL